MVPIHHLIMFSWNPTPTSSPTSSSIHKIPTHNLLQVHHVPMESQPTITPPQVHHVPMESKTTINPQVHHVPMESLATIAPNNAPKCVPTCSKIPLERQRQPSIRHSSSPLLWLGNSLWAFCQAIMLRVRASFPQYILRKEHSFCLMEQVLPQACPNLLQKCLNLLLKWIN